MGSGFPNRQIPSPTMIMIIGAPSHAFSRFHGHFLPRRLHSPSPPPRQAHAALLKSGRSDDPILATHLITSYAGAALFSDATLLLQALPSPDAVSFSALISALSRSNLLHHSLRLFRGLFSLPLPLSPSVFPAVLKACAALSALRAGRQVHGLAAVYGMASDDVLEPSLLHMYVKCGRVRDAHKMFDGMGERNVVGYSALIAGYARGGSVETALRLFDEMKGAGVEPNLVTWNGLVVGFNARGLHEESVAALREMHFEGFRLDGVSISSVLSAIGDLEDLSAGLQAHGYVVKSGLGSDKCVVSALLDVYGKCRSSLALLQVFNEAEGVDVGTCNALVAGLSRNGLVEEALRLFRQFEEQGLGLNVVSWTSMVAACAQNGKDMEALEFFRKMQLMGIKANSITIPCLLPALGNIAALMPGRAAHCFSFRTRIWEDVYVGSALVDMYAKCGKIGDARHVFDMIPAKNVVSWNAIMSGYSMHGRAREAIKMFHLMQSCGQSPDHITFTCVLSACSQAGLVDEGWNYFHSMQHDFGIKIRLEHYACMVSLLSREGKLSEAYQMIKEMSVEPDACVWGAFLSSCRVHGNVGLGEIAAEQLFKLEPQNAGNYVLLSNIYASKGIWAGVNKMRDMMKKMCLSKDPGCSWIELKNKMHTLLAGDKSHPQMTQILEKLHKLSVEMRRSGGLPDTQLVLHDVEEQEKEHILCGHSEKLAVGLGLLNTPPGSPLRIIKNLRTCPDCHDVIKFISKFEGRDIFVRDTNRFHHFKDGKCSCRDYW